MAVDALGPIDPVASLRDIDRTTTPQRGDPHLGDIRLGDVRLGDPAESVSLSSEARVVAELDATLETVNRSPDVREDLVADVKVRLQDPHYLNAKVIDRIAERIQERFGT